MSQPRHSTVLGMPEASLYLTQFGGIYQADHAPCAWLHQVCTDMDLTATETCILFLAQDRIGQTAVTMVSGLYIT